MALAASESMLVSEEDDLRPVSTPLSYLLSFSGIGHGFTEVGRDHWIIVIIKYLLFSLACLGIWFDETYEAYDTEDKARKHTVRDADDATMEFIFLTIASRVILLQALGEVPTLISIIVITTCSNATAIPIIVNKISVIKFFFSASPLLSP